MAIAATETTSLVAFTLPSTPYSVQMARFYVRAALSYHDLGDYAEDAETVTSELVTNAVAHAGAQAIGLELTRLEGSGAVAIVVTDPSPLPPVKRDPAGDTERGRGLHIVDALSARWGWRPARPRQSRVRDPHQGGMNRWRPSPTCRCSTTSTPTTHPSTSSLPASLRAKIKSGHYQHGEALRSADLVSEHGVSAQVAWHALATLAANRYVARSGVVGPYRAIWGAKGNTR